VRYWEVAERFLVFEPAHYGWIGPGQYRDEVFVEDGVAKYQLWNTIIAEFDGKWLTLRTEGWSTRLTFNRINAILNAAGLDIQAGTEKRFPILTKSCLVYPFLDGVRVSMNGTITLPGGIEGDVERLNQEMRQASYRIKAKAVHVLVKKGYSSAISYVRRAMKIAERSRKRMCELWDLYYSACDDVIRHGCFVITVLWLEDPESSVRDRSRFIVAAKTSPAAEPEIYVERVLNQEAVGRISRIVYGKAEPADPESVIPRIAKRVKENDRMAAKFLASIGANLPAETKAQILACVV